MSAFICRIRLAELCCETIDLLRSLSSLGSNRMMSILSLLNALFEDFIVLIPCPGGQSRCLQLSEGSPSISWQRMLLHLTVNTRLCRFHRLPPHRSDLGCNRDTPRARYPYVVPHDMYAICPNSTAASTLQKVVSLPFFYGSSPERTIIGIILQLLLALVVFGYCACQGQEVLTREQSLAGPQEFHSGL